MGISGQSLRFGRALRKIRIKEAYKQPAIVTGEGVNSKRSEQPQVTAKTEGKSSAKEQG